MLLIEVVFGLVEVRKQIGLKGIHVGCSWVVWDVWMGWDGGGDLAGDKVKLLGISD